MIILRGDNAMYHLLKTEICNWQNNWVYPQVEHMGPGYRWDDPGSITHIIANKPLTFIPNMHSFHLSDNTRKTDLISQNYIYRIGLLASAEFQDVIAGYVVQAYEKWPAEVTYHGELFAYAWLHMIEEAEQYISYPRSEFVVRRSSGAEEAVQSPTGAALRGKARELLNSDSGVLAAKRITFAVGTPHFDFFCLCLNGLEFFASDRLRQELEGSGLTGFELEPSNTIVAFDEPNE
jgi:hypothetical protein